MADRGGGCGILLAAALLVAPPGAGAADDGAEPVVEPAAEAAAADPFLGGFLRETRVVYPLRVGGWEATGERMYDAAELGASVRYQSGDRHDRWIDVYFYPVGVVPPSHVDTAMHDTLRDIESGIGAPGGYLAVEPGRPRAFALPRGDGGDMLRVRSVDMALVREEGRYHSAMVLLVDRMYYVKGRYSVAADAMGRDEVRRALEAFIAELVAGTYIGSTGSCWSPAPVEALPAGAEAPADARLSIGSDGGAWLVGDRVLAREPDGDGARALALMAMGLDGRLYPGCVGAEPHNPDVPEGHREIRFEYRAPAGQRRDGGRRLAPSRSGLG